MNSKKKQWTFLFYLNGNNELEPEMMATLKNIEKIKNAENINLIVQIGREDRNIIEIMRPQEVFFDDYDPWVGVRRYLITDENSGIIKDLGNKNMADPNTLKEFITWGIMKYPAENYCVAVASHGFLVASLPDLTGDRPYVMGAFEMCAAINKGIEKTGQKVELLILDICYMNNIEIIYELGKGDNKNIESVLTYREDGPINGLDYSLLIPEIISDKSNFSLDEKINKIINEYGYNLLLVTMDKTLLEQIKSAANKLGQAHLDETTQKAIIKAHKANVKKLLNKLVVVSVSKNENIKIIGRDLYNIENREEFLSYYSRLAFCNDNDYSAYVSRVNNKKHLLKAAKNFKKYVLTRNNIYSFVKVFNFNLSTEEIGEIIDKLYKYKGWDNE